MPQVHAARVGPSTSFTVSGQVEHPKTYHLWDLEIFYPQTAVQEVYTSGQGMQGPNEFEGVLLWDLLTKAVVITNPNIKNDIGLKYVVVTGTDCYQQLFSMDELSPTVGGSTQVTVAYKMNGALLPAGDGFARLIPPGDKGGDRTVYNVMSIEVFNGENLP